MQHARSPRRSRLVLCAAASAAALTMVSQVSAQSTGNRMLGLDVSAWQGNISQTTWNNISNVENRKFVFIRASRGGTTGEYHPGGGYPSGDNTEARLSQRYDDPYYIQNVNRATAAGMFAGSYHFSRPDIIASTPNSNPPGGTAGVDNNGTDEANHFIQMAGPFMRPGYLPPTHDLEAGDGVRTDEAMAQFTLDFSNRVYQVMGIRPAIYINGNYAANILGGASASLRNQIAQPSPNAPTPHSPAYSQLWSARWPNQADPNSIAVQTAHPKDSYTPIYGPWDDYGVTHPWVFWQYASTGRLQSFNNGGSNLDFDVAQGGIEFVKDQLIPALWWGDNSGDWSTLLNWNSGQTPIAPPASEGQLTPLATGPLPTPRLPGAAGTGTGPTSAQNDTVILERPSANITVTLSTGSHDIRKLYQRETLNVTGGSLNINYVPVAESTLFSARLSGATSISGGASLSAHTIHVDPAVNFTAGNANLTLNTLQLQRGSTPAKLIMNGDVTFTGLSGGTATIGTNIGATTTGAIDLAAGTRVFNVADGAAATDLDVLVPITNGALTKSGTGNMKLNVGNGLSGVTTINDGILDVTGANQLGSSVVANMTVTTPGAAGHGGTLRLNNNVSYNLPLALNGGGVNGILATAPGITGALDSGGGTNTWAGTITLNGAGVNGTDPTINQVSAALGSTLVLSGMIQDGLAVGALAKSGDGDVVLTGASANTYGERTRLYGGRLIIEKNGALGAAGSATGATGNTFQLGPSNSTIAFRAPGASPGINYAHNEWINLDGTGNGSFGQLDNLGGANTFAGQIGLSATVDAKLGVSAGSLMLTGGVYTRGAAGSRVINKIGAGTLIVAGDSGIVPTNSLNGLLMNSTVNVNVGTVEMRAPSETATNLPGVTMWEVNPGTALVVESGLFSTGTLKVSGGNVVITPTGSGKTIRTNALNITTGAVDLGRSKVIVDYTGGSPMGSWNGSAYTGLIGQVQSGFDGGTWTGPGIRTSQSEPVLTGIAIAEASDALNILPTETTMWRGQLVDGTTVLAAYTWGGDANLDGELNGDDYFAIDSNVLQSGSVFGYTKGDFNYDGEINGDDYFVLDSNILQAQGSPPISGLTAVPEPASAAVLLSLSAGALLRRRRGS